MAEFTTLLTSGEATLSVTPGTGPYDDLFEDVTSGLAGPVVSLHGLKSTGLPDLHRLFVELRRAADKARFIGSVLIGVTERHARSYARRFGFHALAGPRHHPTHGKAYVLMHTTAAALMEKTT